MSANGHLPVVLSVSGVFRTAVLEDQRKAWGSGLVCGSALAFERRKAGGVGISLGQFQEDDDSCVRAQRECSGSLQCIFTSWYELYLLVGFLKSLLNRGLCLRALGGNGPVRMIGYIQEEFPVLGDQFEVIRPCGQRLPTVKRFHRFGMFGRMGTDLNRPQQRDAQYEEAPEQMSHDPFSLQLSLISIH